MSLNHSPQWILLQPLVGFGRLVFAASQLNAERELADA
jgi:hypothetical protein